MKQLEAEKCPRCGGTVFAFVHTQKIYKEFIPRTVGWRSTMTEKTYDIRYRGCIKCKARIDGGETTAAGRIVLHRESCMECGDSVKEADGKFINRVPNADDYATRQENGAPFPDGEFTCADCTAKIRDSE